MAPIPRLLVEDELARGLLVPCAAQRHLSDRCYFLLIPERRQQNPRLQDFKAWLEAEAIAYREPRGLGPPH